MIDFLVYLGFLLGVIAEGELAFASALIYKDFLNLTELQIFASVYLATLLSDYLFVALGRFSGDKIRKRFPVLFQKEEKLNLLIQKFDTLIFLTYRFFYGFRIALLIFIGINKSIKTSKFLIFSSISTALWTAVIGGLVLMVQSIALSYFKNMALFIPIGLSVIIILVFLKALIRGKLFRNTI
jgi:membrane protein DedA with SNARE-associated domain